VDAPEEGPEGAVRGGGLSLHGRPTGLFITASPLTATLARWEAILKSPLKPRNYSYLTSVQFGMAPRIIMALFNYDFHKKINK
jgi:hypothetical protein